MTIDSATTPGPSASARQDWREGDFLAPGETIDLDNCEREPIHFARAVQAVGWVLVVDDDDRVVQWSANLDEIGAVPAEPGTTTCHDLLGRSALDIVSASDEVPIPTEVGGRTCEIRAHRSRSGALVVELVEVETSPDLPVHVVLHQAIQSLRSAADLAGLCQAGVEAVREILGYDRVWVYRFDSEYNGEVIAESKRDDLRTFLGLHFGAGDIPPQARALFLDNQVRIIRDAGAASVPLVPALLPDGSELDLSDATLRAVSPMHLQYLTNMGVTASASLAIVVGDRLWGLCSAHDYTSPRRLDHRAESMARLLSDVLSIQVETFERIDEAEQRARLAARTERVLASVAGSEAVYDGLAAAPDDLLGLAESDAAIVRVAGRVRVIGDGLEQHDGIAVLQALDRRPVPEPSSGTNPELVVSDRISTVVAELRPDLAFRGIAAMRLSNTASNWIVWLRRPYVETVEWADPMRKESPDPDALDPDASFAIWEKTVDGRSRPWTPTQLGAMRELRSSLGVLVFQRTEQLSRSVAALRVANAELDRFAYVAAHDLKEPLRGIYNYSEILNEELGDEASSNIDVAHSLDSLRRLTTMMSGLVRGLLEYATVGRAAFEPTTVSLAEIVNGAREMVEVRLAERDAEIRLGDDVELVADRTQLVQLFANLFSNAVKYTPSERRPQIDVSVVSIEDTDRGWEGWPHHAIDLPEPTVLVVRDNGIGIDVADRERVFEVFRRLHGVERFGEGSGAGLSIVRRIAERHGGRVWIEDNAPHGTSFVIALSVVPDLGELDDPDADPEEFDLVDPNG